MKRFATILFALSLAVTAGAAHDASKHKGKATEGEIITAGGDQLELKTSAGAVRVSLTGKTKIEHGTQVVDRTHLKPGERVSVFGTKLPGGELVAKEIVIGSGGQGHSSAEHAAKPKKPANPSKARQ
jgi:hypothetical protein